MEIKKYLSAKEKAKELGITTNGLAKTRHLYKHIKKSPRKYLHFAEDHREVVRPNRSNNSRPLYSVSYITAGENFILGLNAQRKIVN